MSINLHKNIIKKIEDYKLIGKSKDSFFSIELRKLIKHHYYNSKEYQKFLIYNKYNLNNVELNKFPFLPSSLFKEIDLKSIPDNKIHKILMSSGTSGSAPSRIYLDRINAQNQTIALSKIMSGVLGNHRLPMLIIDQNPNVTKNTFSARVAAINGFSIFGTNHHYIFDSKGRINQNKLKLFLRKYSNKNFFIFGFTSLVHKCFFELIKNNKYNFSGGILLHGGGWKKMEAKKISNKSFKKYLINKFNFKEVINYYGMIEQTGSIFLECKHCMNFIASYYSDILIRDKNFNIVEDGKKGLIQLFSLLPTSYPGHSILTEDIGEIVKNNNCECSTVGKSFRVHGRSISSDLRGCSDTI
jgi:phenylacetate-coenzyme A ligase PaaK-like adenylate-forming protein